MIVKIAVENRIIQTGSAAPMPMFKAVDTPTEEYYRKGMPMAMKMTGRFILAGLLLVCCGHAAANTAQPTNRYDCISNDKLNKYPEKGSSPGRITLGSIPSLCPGGGADVSCGGGHDCDNEHNPSPSLCGACSGTCIREWDNAANPYVWWVYGYAFLEESWDYLGSNLNEMAHVRAYPAMIYSPEIYTINVARKECTYAYDLPAPHFSADEWEGQVMPPPIKQRSALAHSSLGIDASDVQDYFLEAGLILRTDHDGRNRANFVGHKDKSQCVEFELHSFLDNNGPELTEIIATKDETEESLIKYTVNVLFANMSYARGFAFCPDTWFNRAIIRFYDPYIAQVLVHEWGHHGNIAHPDGENFNGQSNGYYMVFPERFDNEIMTGPPKGDWTIINYHPCWEFLPMNFWPYLESQALVP